MTISSETITHPRLMCVLVDFSTFRPGPGVKMDSHRLWNDALRGLLFARGGNHFQVDVPEDNEFVCRLL